MLLHFFLPPLAILPAGFFAPFVIFSAMKGGIFLAGFFASDDCVFLAAMFNSLFLFGFRGIDLSGINFMLTRSLRTWIRNWSIRHRSFTPSA